MPHGDMKIQYKVAIVHNISLLMRVIPSRHYDGLYDMMRSLLTHSLLTRTRSQMHRTVTG